MTGFGVFQIANAASGAQLADQKSLLFIVIGFFLLVVRLSTQKARGDVLPNVPVRSAREALRSLPWGGVVLFLAIVSIVLMERVASLQLSPWIALTIGAVIVGAIAVFVAYRVGLILLVGLPSSYGK